MIGGGLLRPDLNNFSSKSTPNRTDRPKTGRLRVGPPSQSQQLSVGRRQWLGLFAFAEPIRADLFHLLEKVRPITLYACIQPGQCRSVLIGQRFERLGILHFRSFGGLLCGREAFAQLGQLHGLCPIGDL